MRILTIANCDPIPGQGSGYVIVNYARRLRERGHSVDLLGPEQIQLFPWMKYGKRHRQAAGMLLAALWRSLARSYDVIEFYGAESCLAVDALRRVRVNGTLIISHSNGLETYASEKMRKWLGHETLTGNAPKFYQRMLRLPMDAAFTKADAIITVSESDAEFAVSRGYRPADRVLAIENPLEDTFIGTPVDFERAPVIGFCANWLPVKGANIIKEALPVVLREYPASTTVLIGVGRGFRVEDHFPQDVCSRISVHPSVDRIELQRIFLGVSILMVPSIYEGFSLVAAEAMSCGCALVATRTGFPAALQHEKEAITFPEPTVPALIDGLRRLLGDDSLRREIARNGYERVQRLRWDRAVDQWEGACQRWLGEIRNCKREHN